MKLFLSVVLIQFLFLHSAHSQDALLVDSLKQELINLEAVKREMSGSLPAMYDSSAANALFQLSKLYYNKEMDTAMYYARQSLAKAEDIGYKKGMARAYNIMAAIRNRQGDYIEALNLNKRNLKLRFEIGEKKGIASTYNNIGVIYDDIGNYAEALKNYLASLKILEEIGDKEGAASCYNNIGVIYDYFGNYPLALKNYFLSLKLREETGDKTGIADAYINIGVVYKGQGKYPEALKYYLSALKSHEETGDKDRIATCYNKIGNIYYRQAHYPSALENYFIALKIETETDNKKGIAETENNIGSNYIKLKQFSDASRHLNKALSISKEINDLNILKNTYLGLSELDSAQGNFKQELEHYRLYIIIRDSLVNNENTRKIAQQQMQFDFDKKQEAEKIKFEQEKEISAIKLQKQKAYTYGGFAGATLTLILLFFLYLSYKKQRIAHKELKETQAQLVKSEKMAAFGLMASRVSHEIQNPLNFVNNFSELSQEMVTDIIQSRSEEEKKQFAERLIANLRKINEHGKRASSIISQLQEHSLKGTSLDFFEDKKV